MANLPSNGLLADVHILQVPMIRRSVLQGVVALRRCPSNQLVLAQ